MFSLRQYDFNIIDFSVFLSPAIVVLIILIFSLADNCMTDTTEGLFT